MSFAAPASQRPSDELLQVAAGFDQFFLHDNCTAQYPPQPDTCLHDRLHQQSFTFGGKPGTVYNVTLRIRGIFEPTTITGGDTPDPAHPYFKVGGTVSTADWSQWGIEVSEPKQTYWLNHYPSVGHTIYKEDFEATIAVAAGATVVIRVADGNDRQIDNAKIDPGSAADHSRSRGPPPRRPDVAYRRGPRQNKIGHIPYLNRLKPVSVLTSLISECYRGRRYVAVFVPSPHAISTELPTRV
jgi:hypothetical protein